MNFDPLQQSYLVAMCGSSDASASFCFSVAFLGFALPVFALWWCNSMQFWHTPSNLFWPLPLQPSAVLFKLLLFLLLKPSKMSSAVSASLEYRAFTFLYAVFFLSVFFLPRRHAKYHWRSARTGVSSFSLKHSQHLTCMWIRWVYHPLRRGHLFRTLGLRWW